MPLRTRPVLWAISAFALSHFGAGFGIRAARSQEAPLPPPAPAPAASGDLAIDVEPGAAGLDADALRMAIAHETGVSVTSAVTTRTTRLLVRQDGPDRLRFELVEPGGRRVERSVDLGTVEKGSAVDTAALVAANLLEDEASALIASLRARAEPPPPPKPAVPPVPRRLVLSPCDARTPDIVRHIGADVAPYVGTSLIEKRGTVRHVSLEFVGGHHAGVRGLQFSPLASFGGDFVCGAQLAGIVAHTSGSVTGASASGLIGFHGGSVLGASFSGLAAWIEGSVTGAALAGAALRTEDVTGATGAAFINVARHVEGAQFSAAIAWADSTTGAQIAGAAAFTAREMKGLQFSPLSFASDVHGAQIGVMNIGGYVKGFQLGVLNIARTSDVSVGALSFISEGRTHVDAWANSAAMASVAVQHGSRWVHNYYGVSVSLAGREGVALGPLLGIGLHVPADPLFVDVDLISHLLFDPEKSEAPQSLHEARVIVGLQLAPEFAVYAGPSFNALLTKASETPRARTVSSFEWTVTGDDQRTYFWPGLVAGIRGF